MRSACWYCPIVKKVTLVLEEEHRGIPSVQVTQGWCRPAKDHEAQMKLLEDGSCTQHTLGISFDKYMTTYNFSKARRLF